MKQKPMQEETLWISKAREGDQKAFRALYDLHVAPLFRFLRQFTSETAEDVSSSSIEPEEFEWDETMRVWMQDLDESKRAVFVLYEVEGYSHAEIAEMLGVGESTSRTILSRTKRYLKDRWKNEGIKR